MKPIKMSGLAVLTAFMAVAFVGASSAMAEGSTALCTVDEDPCAAGNIITHVHETSVGKAKLLFPSIPTIECNVLFLGDTLDNGLGNPLTIHGKFTYTSCNNFCSVKEENGPAEISVLGTGAELATVAVNVLMRLTCIFESISEYNGESLEGHALGSLTSSQANGSIVITGQELTGGSGFLLDLTTTPLIPTYISS